MCREEVLPAPIPLDQWRENLLHMTEIAGNQAFQVIGDELYSLFDIDDQLATIWIKSSVQEATYLRTGSSFRSLITLEEVEGQPERSC